MTTTKVTKSQVGEKQPIDFIDLKQMKEKRVSLEISHKERLAARNALVHCRNIKKQPLNVLISFEFAQDQDCVSKDILHIRKLSHYLRMIFQRDGNRESLLIWTRIALPNSVERCMILTHVPDDKIVAFTKQCLGWTFEKLSIEPVDPEKQDRFRDGKYVSVFDEMFAATDHLTRSFLKDVYTVKSSAIRGPRTFNSLKLNKSALIAHRRQTEKAKQMKLFKGFGVGPDKIEGGIVQEEEGRSAGYTDGHK